MSKIEQLRTAQANAAKALKTWNNSIPADGASAQEPQAWQAEWDRQDKAYNEAKAAVTAEEARVAQGELVNSRIGSVDADGRSTISFGRAGGRINNPAYDPYTAGGASYHTRGDIPRAYRQLFNRVPIDNGGFGSFGEFARIIGAHQHDPRVLNLGHGEYSDPFGGFSVPTQFASEIMDTALESEVVRPRAKTLSMTTDHLKVPRWNGSDHSSGTLFGDLDADWTAEGDIFGESTGQLERMVLEAARLFIYTALRISYSTTRFRFAAACFPPSAARSASNLMRRSLPAPEPVRRWA